MSELPRFRGRKAEIVERLRRGQEQMDIARELHTTEGYVANVKSELKTKFRITFTSPQILREHDANVTDTQSRTGAHSSQVAVDSLGFTQTEALPTMPIQVAQSTTLNLETAALRDDVARLKPWVAEQEAALKLSQEKQQLQLREIVLTGEIELRAAVSDICPQIKMMWMSKELYTEVMIRMYRNPNCTWIRDKIPFWVYDRSEHRLRLVLEQIFDGASKDWKTRRLASETILTDSVLEFVDYHANHPLCPTHSMPGLALDGRSWECPEHHIWIRTWS